MIMIVIIVIMVNGSDGDSNDGTNDDDSNSNGDFFQTSLFYFFVLKAYIQCIEPNTLTRLAKA